MTKETFCTAMRLRDQQFNKNHTLEEFVTGFYDFPREQYKYAVISPAMTGLTLLVAEYFMIEPSLVNYTINLEDRADPFSFPFLKSQQGHAPRTYESLYDYFDSIRRKKLDIA